MSMRYSKPLEGPEITWNINDVKKFIGKYGKEKAIEKIAGNMLKGKYVEEMIDTLIMGKDKIIKSSHLTGLKGLC